MGDGRERVFILEGILLEVKYFSRGGFYVVWWDRCEGNLSI